MKKNYYLLPLDSFNQPDGTVREVELTEEEFLNVKKTRGYIYDNSYDADWRAQA